MKRILCVAVYTGLLALANVANAQGIPASDAVRELARGDMRKLVFHDTPKAIGTEEFMTFEEEPLTLANWKGKWLVVNFWATWCAPCRKEMPMLSALQAELGSETFEVLTIATSRNPPEKMQSFFDEIGVTNLPLHRDPSSALARDMGVLGLPATLIISPDGYEVARLTGDADWASEEAKAILKAMISQDGN